MNRDVTSNVEGAAPRARVMTPDAGGGRGETLAPPTLLYVIKQVELAVRARLEDVLRPAGLTTAQYTALTVLERQSDLTSAQLARKSFVTAQSMADMVISLTARGLVARRRDVGDRRRLVLSLTARGRRLLARCRDDVASLEAEMLSGLTRPQAVQLRASLMACREKLAGHPLD